MTIRPALVACETKEGQFSSEYAVSLQTKSGRALSMFVDKTLVTHSAGRSLLRVQAVEHDGEVRVLMPVESFEEGSRWADLAVIES